MNDLFSGSFFRFWNDSGDGQFPLSDSHNIEMTTGGVNLDWFFEDVEAVKEEFAKLEALYAQLQSSCEQSQTIHNSKSVKDLRSRMDAAISAALSINKRGFRDKKY